MFIFQVDIEMNIYQINKTGTYLFKTLSFKLKIFKGVFKDSWGYWKIPGTLTGIDNSF